MIRTEALRVFVTVADCGNIRDAAATLGRTSSAISMSLRQLEDHLGAPLFESDRKHTLSEFGLHVRDIAGRLVRDHDAGIEQIRDLAEGCAGSLKIAAVPSVAAQLLPPVLTEMMSQHAGIRIELFDTDSATAHHLVEDGDVELGIAGRPVATSGLQFQPVFQDPFRLVCRSDNPLAALGRPVTWADLTGHRLIANQSTAGFQPADLASWRTTSRLSARNVISLLALARAGAGVTLLPALATLSIGSELCALPLADPAAEREVGFVLRTGRTRSPVCRVFQRRFLDSLQEDGITTTAGVGLARSAASP